MARLDGVLHHHPAAPRIDERGSLPRCRVPAHEGAAVHVAGNEMADRVTTSAHGVMPTFADTSWNDLAASVER